MGLKLFVWPVPVVFGLRCVEGSILLRGVGVVKVVKAIEYLGGEAQGKRGEGIAWGGETCIFRTFLFCTCQVCRSSPTSDH